MQKQTPWKHKVQEVFQVCQDELRKTTTLGKKMLSASKTSTCLHQSYEELGRLVARAWAKGEVELPNYRTRELAKTIAECEADLREIELQMNKIKFASGPEVIGPEHMRDPRTMNDRGPDDEVRH